jgi:pimeloyl-ACP methyl ester carboxylesterase
VLGAVDILDDLGSITCPATVVAGELDTSCTPASMRQIAEGLGDATFHVLSGAAHMLPLEQPFALARHLYAGTRRSPQIVRR